MDKQLEQLLSDYLDRNSETITFASLADRRKLIAFVSGLSGKTTGSPMNKDGLIIVKPMGEKKHAQKGSVVMTKELSEKGDDNFDRVAAKKNKAKNKDKD